MQKRILLFLGILAVMWACNSPKETPSPTRLGYDFYPLEVGQYSIYDIYQIRFTPDNADTTNYQIKEQVIDTLIDANREVSFLIWRYSRATTASQWRLDSAWLTKRTPYLAIRKENNIDYAKLSFPLKEGKQWNGNEFNSFGAETYQAVNLDQPYQVQDSLYPKTVTIAQKDETSEVAKDRRLEVYARDKGLIYKERIQHKYAYKQTDSTVIYSDTVESGITYILRLREFGVGQ